MTTADIGLFVTHLHPLVIHFPIAMVFAAAGAEVLVWVFGAKTLAPAVRFCLHLGLIGAVLGVATGWLKFVYGPLAEVPKIEPDLQQHRLVGTIAAIAVLIVAILYEVLRKRNDKSIWIYRALLFVSTGLIAFTGHLGGALVYGSDYLSLPTP